MLTRRAALKGGTAVACAAAAGMVAAPALAAESNPDARVFALIEERATAAHLVKAAEDRWFEAFQEALPPHLRAVGFRDTSREDRALFNEVLGRPSIEALSAERRRFEDECKAVVERLAETPASTLEGIHAKFQDAIQSGRRGRYLNRDIALSAVDDLARLAGRAEP